MKETRCARCGETVVFVDYGDNPDYLIGKCQSCHLKGEYLEGQGFKWEVWDKKELRLERARKALRKAIASEQAKYVPSGSLIDAYTDGLNALKGGIDE